MRYRKANEKTDDTRGLKIGDWIIFDESMKSAFAESLQEEEEESSIQINQMLVSQRLSIEEERPIQINQMLVSKKLSIGENVLLVRDKTNREYYYSDGVFRKATEEEIEKERIRSLFQN